MEPLGTQDLSSPTRDGTHTPCSGGVQSYLLPLKLKRSSETSEGKVTLSTLYMEGYQGDNSAGDKTGEALPTRSLLTWILKNTVWTRIAWNNQAKEVV